MEKGKILWYALSGSDFGGEDELESRYLYLRTYYPELTDNVKFTRAFLCGGILINGAINYSLMLEFDSSFVPYVPINTRVGLIHHNSGLGFNSSLVIYKSLPADVIANVIDNNIGDGVFIGLTTLSVANGDINNFLRIYRKSDTRIDRLSVLFAFFVGASVNKNSINFLYSIDYSIDILSSLVSAIVVYPNAVSNAKLAFNICLELSGENLNEFTDSFYQHILNTFGDSNELKACLEVILQSERYNYSFFSDFMAQYYPSNALTEFLSITDV